MSTGRPHWWPVYVGIGSNLNDPRRQVRSALSAMGGLPASRIVRTSRLYRSPPMDGTEQPDYINAVAAMLTQLDPSAFLHALQTIENQHGRERHAERWGPRTLDLDLLVFGDLEISNNELTVPHPGIASRSFVLLPLCEVAPRLRVPGLAVVQDLSNKLSAAGSVISVPDEQ
jgi:2-amino-4-hydroxy-6-hydroxymethyldihydropteridine diphosphokinase